MPRQRVPRKDVHAFVAELEKSGATRIRRSGVDVRGGVTVRWKPSVAEEREVRAALRSYKFEFAISLIVVAFVVATLILFAH